MPYTFNQLLSLYKETPDIVKILNELTSYEDPCFILMHCEGLTPTQINTFFCDGLSFIPESSSMVFPDDNIMFISIDMDHSDAVIFCEEYMKFLSENNSIGYISVFRHNPIGSIEKTFKMAVMQLHQILLVNNEHSFFAINDYTDNAHWPGIAEYDALFDAENAAVQTQNETTSSKKGFFQKILQKISSSKKTAQPHSDDPLDMAASLLSFTPDSALEEIAPFIVSLPAGDQLWRYVLTGENRQQLDQHNLLLDLDHILLFVHAQSHAPLFYKSMLRATRMRGLSTQYEIYEQLDDILSALTEELLGKKDNKEQRQGCYLRIVDIFYHLFDQAPLPKELYKILVKKKKTSCLTEDAYQQRFNLDDDIEKNSDQLTPSQEKKFNEVLAKLEDGLFVNYPQFEDINELWSQSRHCFSPESWGLQGDNHERQLAAICLAKDHKQGIIDEKTQALQQLIDKNFLTSILDVISEQVEYGKTLPLELEDYLKGESCDFETLLSNMKACLRLDGYNVKRDAKQPAYDVMSDVEEFSIILSTCYWRELSGSSILTQRLIALFLELAPQAVLSCFSQLYRETLDDFYSTKQACAFYQSLSTLNVLEAHQFAFRIHMGNKHDITLYESLIKEYSLADTSKKIKLDEGIMRLVPQDYQQFYADVCASTPTFNSPLADEWLNVFDEIYHHAQRLDEAAFSAHFPRQNILFSDDIEFLPEQYDLPIRSSAESREVREGLSFAVVRLKGEFLEVLIGNLSNAEQENHIDSLHMNDLIVIDESVTNKNVFSVYSELPNREERRTLFLESVTQYLAGEINFEQYQQRTQYWIDTKVYDLDIDNYSDGVGTILPVIQTENNLERQLRFIKILTSHPSKGKHVLADIALSLFLDLAYREGDIDLEEKHTIELDDLTSKAHKKLQAFQKTMQQQLTQLT